MNTDSSLSPTNKDSTLMNTSSNLNMMQTATSHHEQYQSINDDLIPASNDTSSSVNNMISSLTFSKTVTNSTHDCIYPWRRPGIHKLIEKNDVLKMHKCSPSFFLLTGFNFEHKRSRTGYTHHQLRELEREFHIHKYVPRWRQIEIGRRLALTERQIHIWFQGRRCKWQHDKFKSRNNPHVELEAKATNHGRNHHSYAI
ncbi:unnamed protein product [Rotaria sordida]|uniref:Homeobox domain-containing protein n=1 Tax=Rotaria sordida TaxID=392033 RepID=A0A815ZB10_9BILA|nr:unnamed protein product [Rotaria sordida]CAF1582167.1 unnamed protein product [Rotaria sordida]